MPPAPSRGAERRQRQNNGQAGNTKTTEHLCRHPLHPSPLSRPHPSPSLSLRLQLPLPFSLGPPRSLASPPERPIHHQLPGAVG